MSIKDKFIEEYNPERVFRGDADRNVSYYARGMGMERYKTEAFDPALAKIEEWESSETLDIPPFSDDLSKDEMIQHLRDFHYADRGGFYVAGQLVSGNGTKATKDELRRHHEDLHQNFGEAWDVKVVHQRGGQGGITLEVALPRKHKHGQVVLDAEASKVLAAVRNNQKASGTTLGARDQKVLKELVDNDFGSMKAEMRAFAADALSVRVTEINEEWDRKEQSLPDFATRATEQHRKHDDKVRALRERQAQKMRLLTNAGKDEFDKIAAEAKDKGVVLKQDTETYVTPEGQRAQRTVFKAEVEGRKEAIAEATKDNQKMLDRALMTVEKQRLTAQRQVLLSSVPDAAMPIIESIPDAKTLMVEAQMIPAAEIETSTTS